MRDLQRALPPELAAAKIAAGERDAISLAVEIGVPSVVLDDRQARRYAAALGVRTVGTLGVLALAKDRGLLALLAPEIEQLLSHRFFVAPEVFAEILRRAGE